ncbi:hypothetical protein EJ04DRAFT_580876 [Polyplosphaeria fusca]|uniref:DUF6594 domain-containing protein n=1 Tax=Polyplosphaeria fusca TaxID=682080 RepID=A0A9P4QML3_9PLEO|nr:hypothetical protein EJ04DRAFT_580876 [Polyplosphaeria fusca]
MEAGRLRSGFTDFYDDIALYPETGRFRRFTAHFAKKLHDDTEEVLQMESAVNGILRNKMEPDSGATLLNCSRIWAVKQVPEVSTAWDDYEKSLVKFGRILCLSQQVLNLPHQSAYAQKRLQDFDIYKNDQFGPTGEAAYIYQGPSYATDTCAWRTAPASDFLTTYLLSHSNWIEKHVMKRFEKLRGGRTVKKVGKGTHVTHSIIVGVMDVLACIVANFLLTAAMYALDVVRPLKGTIAVIGTFGLVFSLALKAVSSSLSRGEVFGATAAYFAVASVFVGGTSNSRPGN